MSSSCAGHSTWQSPNTTTQAATGETLNLTHVFNRFPTLTALGFQFILVQKRDDAEDVQVPILNSTIPWDPSTPFGLPSTQNLTSPVWAPIDKTCLTAVYYIWQIPSDLIDGDRSFATFYVSSKWDLTSDNGTFSSPGGLKSQDFIIRKQAVAAPLPTDMSTTVASSSTSNVSLASSATSTPEEGDISSQSSPDAGTLSFAGRLAVGIALPILACMLLFVGWWLWRRRGREASPPTSHPSTSEQTRFEKAELGSPAEEQRQELDGKHLVEVEGHHHSHGSSPSATDTYELDASEVPRSPSVPKPGNSR
ncbi:uncharacterized protein B0I36DRAFT_389672 [Microdochium trichocladiopsis]|uniref:Uncharacterized protein n=1 Tax=Microdochium trichocladiopsis TaxID=1682393 RepID=A0A9P8XQF3_9PEZI|nr:uncharacterized protein B0I36DRAFT_389672 [Microdochium trichocladiopsis]KAH7012081.1 hypothetical protein B0I36DRAFT_389672 [Microdochium trichocladiopsis]